MDFRKKVWEEKPVVLEKPRRGREMVTTEVPKVKTAQKGGGELYHEGWVGDKKYLVPDSNLEIMKDLVNLKIRRKGESVFVKDHDYEASKFDTQQTFQRRLKAMTNKIDDLEAANLVKKKSIYKTSDAAESAKESTGSSVRRKPFEIVPMTHESNTFLISGHIRQSSKPLFIIQKYKGKSPFGRKGSDFSQIQSAHNVDILIAGNFFRKSILEEGLHSIEGVRVKWNLLVPVDERSKLYDRRFSEHFSVKGVDILFEGDFIRGKGLLNYTPILTFLVPQPFSSRRRRDDRRKEASKIRSMYRAIGNVFSGKNWTTYNVLLDNKLSMKSTTDDCTTRDNSSVEELGGNWRSVEGLDEEQVTDKEHTDENSGHDTDDEDKGDNVSRKVHFVTVSSTINDKRSVAGGSSCGDLPEDRTTVSVPDENMADWNIHDVDFEGETVVVFAPKDEIWNPFDNAEPHLRSCSSHSSWEQSVSDKERSDHGDSGRGRCSSTADDRSDKSKGIGGLRPKNLQASGDDYMQRTFCKEEFTKKDALTRYEIPEYKCQVRPSKRGPQRNCLMRNISKLFSK